MPALAVASHVFDMATAHKYLHIGYFLPSIFRDFLIAIRHCVNYHILTSKV